MASKDLRFFIQSHPGLEPGPVAALRKAARHPALWSLCNESSRFCGLARRGRLSAGPEGAVCCYPPKCVGSGSLRSEGFCRPGRGAACRTFGIGCIRGEAQDGIRIMGGGVTKCEGSFTFAPIWIVSALQQKGCEGFSFSFLKYVFVSVHIVLTMQRYWVRNAIVLVWTPYAGLLMLMFSKN